MPVWSTVRSSAGQEPGSADEINPSALDRATKVSAHSRIDASAGPINSTPVLVVFVPIIKILPGTRHPMPRTLRTDRSHKFPSVLPGVVVVDGLRTLTGSRSLGEAKRQCSGSLPARPGLAGRCRRRYDGQPARMPVEVDPGSHVEAVPVPGALHHPVHDGSVVERSH